MKEEHRSQIRTHTPEDIKKIESKWVGLTDDDYEELLKTRDWGVYLIEAVEAKLKEKNT